MAFVPGYLGTITLNAETIKDLGGHVIDLNMQRNVMTLPLFGQAWAGALEGQRQGTFTASGTIDSDKLAALQTAFESGPVAFSIQVGAAGEATDGGVYTGSCIVSNLTINAAADGKWEWSITATTNDAVFHTPGGGSSS